MTQITKTRKIDREFFECHDEGRKVVDLEFANKMECLLVRARDELRCPGYSACSLAEEIDDFLFG